MSAVRTGYRDLAMEYPAVGGVSGLLSELSSSPGPQRASVRCWTHVLSPLGSQRPLACPHTHSAASTPGTMSSRGSELHV